MSTIVITDALGTNQNIEKPNPNGRSSAVGSRPVSLCTEDFAALTAPLATGSNLIGSVGINNMAFAVVATAVLASSNASQTVTFASGTPTKQIVIYNGGAGILFLKLASTITIPGSTPDITGIICVAPSTSQTFTLPMNGGALSYIASDTGGPLVIMTGNGY